MSLAQPATFHERRIKGIGGSEVAAIMGVSPYKTAFQLWNEKTKRVVPADISHLPHVVRGINGEITARMILEREWLKSIRPKTWKGIKEYYLATDDGYIVDDNSLCEIKCMGKENHNNVAKGIIPEHYRLQCQWNLFVSGARICHFISFRPEDESMHRIEVLPNPEDHQKLAAAVDNFWLNHVKADKPPELTEKDYVEVKDEKLKALTEEYSTLYRQSKAIESRLEALKDELQPFTQSQPAIRCGEVKLLRSERAGAIDYKRMLKERGLDSVDLEGYRKNPSPTFRIFVPDIDLSTI